MNVEWVLIRGSGIAAFALLTASVVWGLLVSTKIVARLVKAKPLTWFHESLGIGALLATLVHVAVISMHDFLDFTWAEILIPGRSDWKPLPVGFGIFAFYGLMVIVASFYVRRWIGQRVWRLIHFGSLGVFIASLVHGIQAGSDTSQPLVLGMYVGAAIVVFGLVAHRITATGIEAMPDRPPSRSGTTPDLAPAREGHIPPPGPGQWAGRDRR
jgi:hypothetical protein